MPTKAAKKGSQGKQIDALKKKVAAQKEEIAGLKKRAKEIEKWIKLEVVWAKEVTKMLRQIDWTELQTKFPGGPGTNPPKTGPDWPTI